MEGFQKKNYGVLSPSFLDQNFLRALLTDTILEMVFSHRATKYLSTDKLARASATVTGQ